MGSREGWGKDGTRREMLSSVSPRLLELLPSGVDNRAFIGDLVKSIGGSALGETAKAFCKAVASGNKAAVAAVVAGLSGGQLIAVAILAGGAALQLAGDRADDRKQQERFKELGKAVEACGNDVERLADLLLPFIEHKEFFLARLPGHEKAELARFVADAVKKELTPLLPEEVADIDWNDVRIYLNNNNDLLHALHELATETNAGVKQINQSLQTGRVQLPTIPKGVDNNLAAAGIQPNPDFVGRDDLIIHVHEALDADGPTALTHALSAEGGVGKTEVAIAYVFDEEYAPKWQGIWWLDASKAGIDASLESVLRVMGYERKKGDSAEMMRAEFVRRLGDGRHLVVLDNIDDRATLVNMVMPTTTHVLVTTRLAKEKLPTSATTIEVELFEPDDAARLLVKHRADLRDEATGLPRPEHVEAVGKIAEELGLHALAVALAAAALKHDAGVSPGDLLERLRSAEVGADEHPFADQDDDETGRRYGKKVAASLLLHLPELENTTPLAGKVLLLASLYHAEKIPIALLDACLKADAKDVRKAVLALRDRSIVRFDASAGVDGRGLVSLHRLTQSAMRHRAGEKEVRAVLELLLVVLNGVFDDPRDPERWPAQAEALPHALACLERQTGDSQLASRLLNQVAYFHNALGRAAEAEPMHEQALAMRRRLYKGDHPDVATSLNNLAGVRQSLGRAAEAEPMYAEALEMIRRLYEGDHSDVARSLNNLAFMRRVLGRETEAEPMYVEALAMHRRLYKGDHPNVATSLNNLADVRESLDRAAEAEPIFEEALAMRRRLYKGDHPDVASSLNNLAGVRESLGRAAEAEPMYVEALEMRRRLYEGDHPDVAQSLNNLAAVRESLGRAAEAEPMYREALAMRRRLYKDDHPDVASSLNNLAYCHVKQGRWRDALLLLEEAVAMARRCLPEGHPRLVGWEHNLAYVRERLEG